MTPITDKEKQEALYLLDAAIENCRIHSKYKVELSQKSTETIRAALSQTPEGFVMVPIDPTEKMFNAFVDVVNSDAETTGTGSFQLAYAALIHAAPKPTEKTDD